MKNEKLKNLVIKLGKAGLKKRKETYIKAFIPKPQEGKKIKADKVITKVKIQNKALKQIPRFNKNNI